MYRGVKFDVERMKQKSKAGPLSTPCEGIEETASPFAKEGVEEEGQKAIPLPFLSLLLISPFGVPMSGP